MRVLLDESVPRRLAHLILGHEVTTVVDHGWAGLHNGELLGRASGEFDVFVTVDKNLPRQQDLQRFPIAVVILEAPTNRLDDLRPLVPQLPRALDEASRPAIAPTMRRLPVDVAAMADLDDDHYRLLVVDRVDDAKVALSQPVLLLSA